MMPPINKRARSDTVSTVSTINSPKLTENAKANQIKELKTPENKTKKKNLTTDNSSTLKEISLQLDSAKKTILDNKDKYPLNLQSLSEFLQATFGKQNIIDTTLTYTSAIADLISMLNHIKPLIVDKNLGRRITKIINKLNCHLVNSEYLSGNSSSSEENL